MTETKKNYEKAMETNALLKDEHSNLMCELDLLEDCLQEQENEIPALYSRSDKLALVSEKMLALSRCFRNHVNTYDGSHLLLPL